MKPWKRRGQKARDSELWRVSLCVLSPLVDEIPVSYVAERLAPHLVKVGRRTECEAMIRHQLFERVPIALARGKKIRCQWLDEMKEGADGSFVRSRLVATEVVHGIRFDTFAQHLSNAARSSSQEPRHQ